ncbi:MAG: hypothetical protein GEV10_06365 [Streptosporangiales bacterium]|nr:hypothetical protein [Streptosporangiales bacterium]
MNAISDPPERSTDKAVAATIIEAGLSAVPVVGGPVAVIWAAVVGAAYEKRREQWQKDITEAVQDLLDQVDELTAESLAQNTEFLDALAHATASATATGQQDKLDALRNAVLNSALPSDLDSDTRAMFLRYVRDFTPSHLRLLRLLANPLDWYASRGLAWPNLSAGGLSHIIERGIPELKGRRDLYDRLFADIAAAGFTNTGSLHGMMTGQGLTAERTTEMGNAFLAFVTDPRPASAR